MKPLLLFFLCCCSLAVVDAEAEWHTFRSLAGKTFEGRVVGKTETTVSVQRRVDEKEFTIQLRRLSVADRDYVKGLVLTREGELRELLDIDESVDATLPKDLYPRSRKELAKKMKKISDRRKPRGASDQQASTLNEINIYRYLCGMPDEVEFHEGYSERAFEALKTWAALGDLPMTEELREQIRGFFPITFTGPSSALRYHMEAPGTAMLATKDTRYTLLNPGITQMGIATLAGEGGVPTRTALFPAWANNRRPKFGAYPAAGFFPKDRLYGGSWTFYTRKRPDKDSPPAVEVYRMAELPKSKEELKEPQGEKMGVSPSRVFKHSVIFDPHEPGSKKPISGAGIYVVKVSGSMVLDYVVVLY